VTFDVVDVAHEDAGRDHVIERLEIDLGDQLSGQPGAAERSPGPTKSTSTPGVAAMSFTFESVVKVSICTTHSDSSFTSLFVFESPPKR
jgi:hypothetical protein